MTRQQRAMACAAGIVPLTVACAALLLCGCPRTGWTMEIATAVFYLFWIAAGRQEKRSKRRRQWGKH